MKLTELLRSRSLLKLIATFSLIAITVIVIAITLLYNTALSQHSKLLTESLENQIEVMNTMQLLVDSEPVKDENHEGQLIFNTIQRMQSLNQLADASGRSSEFVVGKRQHNQIVFLLLAKPSEHEHEHANFTIPFDSELAEPMRRALSGEAGTVIGLDHHGEKVLAAYRYMPEYELGIVAKIDIAELLTPYLAAIILISIVSIIFVLIGAYVFARSIQPFYERTQDISARLRRQHTVLSRLANTENAAPCDMEAIFNRITEACSEGMEVTRAGIWMFDDDRSHLHCADQYDQKMNQHGICDSLAVSDYPVYFKTLRENSIIDSVNVYLDDSTRELINSYLKPHDIKAMLVVPIMLNGTIIGVITHEHKNSERRWTPEDQNFASSMANHVSLAMNNCQRNKAEQALKESEERYELAVTGSTDGLWDWNMESNTVYRSPQYKKLLGYEEDEFSSEYDSWLSHLHPDDSQKTLDALNAHLEDASKAYDIEYRLRTKAGDYRWFRCRGNALRDKNGKPHRVSGSITDITNLKQTQDNLGLFKETLDEISENIFMFDPDTLRFFYVNKSAITNTGYTREELMQMTPVDIKPEFNTKSFRQMLSVLTSHPGQSLNFETVNRLKDGSQIPVEIHLQHIVPGNESPRFVAIARNVSERKDAEIENYIQRTMLEHIHQVQDDFITGVDSKIVFEKLLNGLLDIAESEYGFIGEILYDADNQPYLKMHHLTDFFWNETEKNLYDSLKAKGLEFHDLDTLLGAVITSGEAVISNKPSDDPRSGGLPEGHPVLNRFLGIPLKRGDNLIGMVGLANRDLDYTADLLKQLQPMLSTCANLIDAERTEALRSSMENALRSSEEKANTVLATVADGIITINEHGIIESFNLAAERIFGYNADEVIGKNVNLLMPEPYRSKHNEYLKRYHTTGVANMIGEGREVDGKRKDGTVFPLALSINELHSGATRRYTGVVRDISEHKQTEIALIAARDTAEQANRTKSEFLSSMSHELRTPLNAIMGFAQLLQFDAELPSVQKKHAREIYGAGKLLLDLINDVLDLAKIEAGHINLSIDSIRLEQVLTECFKLTKGLTEKHGVTLTHETGSSRNNSCKGIWVRADNTRLKQVLLNLLSNAVKYNKTNGTVHVSCPPAPEGYHRICITDSGRGINPLDIKNLFQPFNRLGAERSEIEGTGIGLVITRKLVELMGGSISVESEPGKGTSFHIDLLASEAISPASLKTSAKLKPKDNANGDQSRILVAEDNRTNQELIALQLNTLGYRADVVANGKEAVQMLHKHKYDLLLTDIHMPEMDGYQLTQAIRDSHNHEISGITVIAITANAAADEATRCLEKGMNDYLSKPVDINKLQNKITYWLSGARDGGGEAATTTIYGTQAYAKPAIPAEDTTTPPIDTATLSRYVGSDPDKHRHFFRLFLETAPETILAIHTAYNSHSYSAIKDTCHKLKSSARAIGAVGLSTLCQHMETSAINEDWKLIEEAMPEINKAMNAVESYIHSQLGENKTEPDIKFNFDDVMIVDDDRFVLDLVTSRLNNIGINTVITASSGEDALALINNSAKPPSVLLLDLNMPGMDGVEFLRHLSEFSYQGSIILISGEDTRLLRSAESIARDRKLNILGALEKPVAIPSLTELLLLVGAEIKARPSRDKISLSKQDLLRGIENDELVVYYQPQIDITSKELSGVEALVRWIHPERGMIPPDAFIPIAEELNLINDMTDIILNKALHQCADWREHGININVSVNISVDSLNRLDLPEYIVKCAKKHELDVSMIMLEITESRLMQDITSALDILTRLSLKGIRLSIDDFGTGYSSMEQLQRVPFTELKIDRSFVNGALHNKAARAILESSINLAKKLNMTIVAEGVENDEDLRLITGLGCTYAQGYYIGRPMPGDEIITWHDEWKSRH